MIACPFSERQLEAIQKAAEDKIAKVIAFEMGTSVNTVINYLHISRLKIGVGTTTGLVAYCLRQGWIK